MQRCETCKHWQADKKRQPPWVPTDKKLCKRITDGADEAELNYDVECYDLWIETRADFGCVLHEAT